MLSLSLSFPSLGLLCLSVTFHLSSSWITVGTQNIPEDSRRFPGDSGDKRPGRVWNGARDYQGCPCVLVLCISVA